MNQRVSARKDLISTLYEQKEGVKLVLDYLQMEIEEKKISIEGIESQIAGLKNEIKIIEGED